jgi:hypothetical protein
MTCANRVIVLQYSRVLPVEKHKQAAAGPAHRSCGRNQRNTHRHGFATSFAGIRPRLPTVAHRFINGEGKGRGRGCVASLEKLALRREGFALRLDDRFVVVTGAVHSR